jgi:hypothetical protein
MRDLYEYGFTIVEIGEFYGLTATPTRDRLLRAGTTLRPRNAHLPKPLSPEDEFCYKGHSTEEFGSYKAGRFYCKRCNADAVASYRKWGPSVHRN